MRMRGDLFLAIKKSKFPTFRLGFPRNTRSIRKVEADAKLIPLRMYVLAAMAMRVREYCARGI